MSEHTSNSAAGFWAWFEAHESDFRHRFKAAMADDDHVALQEIIDVISEAVQRVAPGLMAQLHGPPRSGPPTFGLVVRAADPEVQQLAEAFMAAAPDLPHWEWTPPNGRSVTIIVRDDEGRELRVSWQEISLLLLPPAV